MCLLRRHLSLDALHRTGADAVAGAILCMPSPPFARATRMAFAVTGAVLGRPSVLPSSLARARPARTRS
jgi:hypothetical protein